MANLKSFFVSKKYIIILTLVLLSVVIYFIFFNQSPVQKTTIQKGNLKSEFVLSGSVKADNHVKMSFETVGKIVYVGVKEGDFVPKGKLLTKLDTTVLNSVYQQSLSTLRSSEASLADVYDQLKGKGTSETYSEKETRTTAEVTKDKAYESVVQAKRNLDGASLYAPFSGYVTLLTNPFAGVYSGTGVQVELIDPSTLYVTASVDQSDLATIQPLKEVDVIFDAFQDQAIKGRVDFISFAPSEDESGAVYEVKIKIDDLKDLSEKIRVGMTADVIFILDQKEDVLYVDQKFVRSDDKGSYLITKTKNKVYVETGIESEEFVEVIGDLSEGQEILF